MRLTKGADYGARGVVYLARQPTDSVVLVGEIANAEGMPESYLAKIFQSLSREGIVQSHRGAGGGPSPRDGLRGPRPRKVLRSGRHELNDFCHLRFHLELL